MVLSRFLRAHYGYDGRGHHFETNQLLFVSLMMSASGCVSLTLGQQVGGLGGDLGAKTSTPSYTTTLEVTLKMTSVETLEELSIGSSFMKMWPNFSV